MFLYMCNFIEIYFFVTFMAHFSLPSSYSPDSFSPSTMMMYLFKYKYKIIKHKTFYVNYS